MKYLIWNTELDVLVHAPLDNEQDAQKLLKKYKEAYAHYNIYGHELIIKEVEDV